MKKSIPIVLLLLGVLVVAGAYFFVIRDSGKEQALVEEEEIALLDVPLEERPVLSLTPRSDGHWLDMSVEKITIDAFSMDYELIYDLPDGRQQGVPGTVKLQSGQDSFEAELLLGSESSGKFRYDEGVEEGTLTLRFRNDQGQLLAKFISNFHMQTQTRELTSIDGQFTYTRANKDLTGDYFVTMNTIGYPGDAPGDVQSGPYGVFSSSSEEPGEVDMSGSVYYYGDGGWELLEDGVSSDVGIFLSVN